MNTTRKTPGQIAFEACNAKDTYNFLWEHCEYKPAWEAAAAAVLADQWRPVTESPEDKFTQVVMMDKGRTTTARTFYGRHASYIWWMQIPPLPQPVDEYADQRKALSEGKFLEVRLNDTSIWYDLPSDEINYYTTQKWQIRVKDEFADLKAAHAAGKVIQFRSKAQAAANDWSNPLDLVGPYPDWGYPVNQFRVKPWTLSRHLHGFRPLEDGEEWLEFAPWEEKHLPQGYRPLLKGETPQPSDENQPSHGYGFSNHSIHLQSGHWRTTRPLPPVTPKLDDGWTPWTGGERPVDKETMVKFKLQGDPNKDCGPHYAGFLQWRHDCGVCNIVAYKVTEEKQPDPLLARIDAAIAELNKIKEEITK